MMQKYFSLSRLIISTSFHTSRANPHVRAESCAHGYVDMFILMPMHRSISIYVYGHLSVCWYIDTTVVKQKLVRTALTKTVACNTNT